MTITEFLEARVAEDEAAAKACYSPTWAIDRAENPLWVSGLGITAMDSTWDACIAVTDAEHVVRHDPTRVLAECAAKRAALDLFKGIGDSPDRLFDPMLHAFHKRLIHSVIRPMAAVYKDHADWKEAWAA